MSKYVLMKWLAERKEELVERSGCHKCGKGLVPPGFVRYWQDDLYRPHDFILRLNDSEEVEKLLPPEVRKLSAWQLPVQRDMTKEMVEAYVECCHALCRKCYDPRNKNRR